LLPIWPWLGKLPLGRLPGVIVIDKPSFKIYIPIATIGPDQACGVNCYADLSKVMQKNKKSIWLQNQNWI
jgi:hypothetical protein